MKLPFLQRFRQDDDGAVTVDWVVLTAGVLGMGILVVSLISDGATDTSTSLGARLSAAEVTPLDLDGP